MQTEENTQTSIISDKQKKILLDLSNEGLLFHCPSFCAPDVWNDLFCHYCKKDKIITRCLSKEEERELMEGPGKGAYDSKKYEQFRKEKGL